MRKRKFYISKSYVKDGSVFTTFESRSCIELSRSCKALRALPPREVWGHGPPGNFEILDSLRCIFQHFEVQNGMFRYIPLIKITPAIKPHVFC